MNGVFSYRELSMNSLRRMILAVSAAAAVLLTTGAVAADANLTGEWDVSVETPMGVGTPHFSLKQDGNKLSGTYKGQLGQAPVTGTVKGDEFTIQFQVEAQGMDIAIIYQGKAEGSTISGTAKLGDFGEGTFTGKKAG